MKGKRFTEEQISYALRQAESGVPVAEVCRKLQVTEQSFYRWKRKYTGMGVAELRRLKQLERENRKLKQIVADCFPSEGTPLTSPGVCSLDSSLRCTPILLL